MRLNTTLFTVGVLLGTALADINTIKVSMKDAATKAENLTEAIKIWPGTASSGADMLCKTLALRKSLDACVEAVKNTPKRMTNKEMGILLRTRLVGKMFKLRRQAIKAKPHFDRTGVTVSLFEVIKTQKEPTSDMSKAIKVIADKLPPDFKEIYLVGKPQTPLEFLQGLMNNVTNDLLEDFEPRPEQRLSPLSLITPFVPMAVQASKSIDAGPFCRSIPQLMNTLARQSTNLREITNQTLKVLESSRVQDVVIPLEVMKKGAKAAGMPPNVIPNVLKKNDFFKKGLPLPEFTGLVSELLRTNVGTLTNKALKVLDFPRVQNVVIPLDLIKNGATASGMPPDFIPNVVKKIGISEQRLSLSEITKRFPELLSTKISTLTTQALEVLKSSGVQDLAPLDFIKVAEVIGVSRDTTDKALKKIGISKKRLSLREFTKQVPRLLNNVKFKNKALGDMVLGDIVLGDMVLDTPTIIRFADSVVKTVLGSTPR